MASSTFGIFSSNPWNSLTKILSVKVLLVRTRHRRLRFVVRLMVKFLEEACTIPNSWGFSQTGFRRNMVGRSQPQRLTGQWHLRDHLKKHKYSNNVINKKKKNPTIVFELLATGEPKENQPLSSHTFRRPPIQGAFKNFQMKCGLFILPVNRTTVLFGSLTSTCWMM